MEKIIKKCADSLKHNGYIVLFCENIRDINGNMIPQSFDICKIMQKYFHLKDERIICYEKDTSDDGLHITNRAHEYVLIGKKKEAFNNIKIQKMKEIAKKLSDNTNSALIGSLGLYYICKEALDNPPYDVDMIIENTLDNIKKSIYTLKENGYKVYSWQDEITDDFDFLLLKDRHYIRGIKDDIIVDCSYEINDKINYEKFRPYLILNDDNIYSYPIETFKYMFKYSSRKDILDRLFIIKNVQ